MHTHTIKGTTSKVRTLNEGKTKVVLVGFCFMDGPALASKLGKHLGRPIEINNDLTVFDQEKESNTLLLVNRDINPDIVDGTIPDMYNDGVVLVRDLESKSPKALVALVSNQKASEDAAIQSGAVRGFGKAEILDTDHPDFSRFDALVDQASVDDEEDEDDEEDDEDGDE